MATFGAIIVPSPILIVLDLAVIDVPFNPTLSSIIIFAVFENVQSFVGANSEVAVHLCDEEIILTLFPIIISLFGTRIIIIFP